MGTITIPSQGPSLPLEEHYAQILRKSHCWEEPRDGTCDASRPASIHRSRAFTVRETHQQFRCGRIVSIAQSILWLPHQGISAKSLWVMQGFESRMVMWWAYHSPCPLSHKPDTWWYHKLHKSQYRIVGASSAGSQHSGHHGLVTP